MRRGRTIKGWMKRKQEREKAEQRIGRTFKNQDIGEAGQR